MAYSKHGGNRLRGIYLYSLDDGRTTRLSGDRVFAEHPVFDVGGRYLCYAIAPLAPGAEALGMSSLLYRPLVEHTIQVIDLEGGDPRPQPLDADVHDCTALMAGRPGYLLVQSQTFPDGPLGRPHRSLLRVNRETGDRVTLVDDCPNVTVSRDGGTLLVIGRGGPSMVSADSANAPAVPLDPGKLVMTCDPRAEWRQIFHEAVRDMREFFYDDHFHGQDLAALEAKYAAWLPQVVLRRDVNRLIRLMFAQVAVSHLDVEGGMEPVEAPARPVGLLGADYEISAGKWRISRIYHGDNSHPLLTAPLDQAGVDVHEGEYLLALNGEPIDGSRNIFSCFDGQGRKPLEIRVGPNPDGTASRTFKVRALPGENTLRRFNWAQENRRKVEALSGGRLGYIYLPDTGRMGFNDFNRDFYAAADRDGLVVDERYNSGGAPADYMIEVLGRRDLSWYTFRNGTDLPFPNAIVPGPRVMITNELSGSGGDTLPWMFRRAGLGPLVGATTMGAGIGGYLDCPDFVDGGHIRIPSRGFYNPDGSWDIENGGVAPDYPVEILPSDWRAGHDRQLESAVDLALKALAKQPVKAPKRPEYPVKP